MRHPSVIAEYVRTYTKSVNVSQPNRMPSEFTLSCGSAKSIARLIGWSMRSQRGMATRRSWALARAFWTRSAEKVTGIERRAHGFRRYLAPSCRPGTHEQQLVQLQDALSKDINAGDSEATEAIHDLVETVTVFRGPTRPGGVTVEIAGRLTALLHEPVFPNHVRGVWGKVVAREGLEPPTPGL